MELCLTAIADVERKNVLAVATFMFSEWAIKVNSINIDTYVFRVDALADSNQQHQEQQDEWNAPCTHHGVLSFCDGHDAKLIIVNVHFTSTSRFTTKV